MKTYLKRCPNCGLSFVSTDNFCGKDGVKLEPAQVDCSKCGTVIWKTEKFCTECGEEQHGN